MTKKSGLIIPILLSLVLILSTTIDKKLWKNTHFEVLKELAEPIVNWQKGIGKENTLVVMNLNNSDYLNYYVKASDSIHFDLDILNYDDELILKSTFKNSSKPYLIIGYSARLTIPFFFNIALSYYPYIKSYKKYNNSAVFLLSKNKADDSINLTKKTISQFPKNKANWIFKSDNLDSSIFKSDKQTVYEPLYVLSLKESNIDLKSIIEIEIESDVQLNSELTIVISPENKNNEPINDNYGKPIWIGLNIEKELLENGKAYYSFNVPPQVSLKDKLKIYLWNRNGVPTRIKNITINEIVNIWN